MSEMDNMQATSKVSPSTSSRLKATAIEGIWLQLQAGGFEVTGSGPDPTFHRLPVRRGHPMRLGGANEKLCGSLRKDGTPKIVG